MSDGHLNKCKACTKKDAHDHRENNLDKIRAYDRSRGSLPHRLEAVRNRAHRYKHKQAEQLREYRKKNPEKNKAREAVGRATRCGQLSKLPCQICGGTRSEAHHEDYSLPLDVVWLCDAHHKQRHKEIRWGEEYGVYS